MFLLIDIVPKQDETCANKTSKDTEKPKYHPDASTCSPQCTWNICIASQLGVRYSINHEETDSTKHSAGPIGRVIVVGVNSSNINGNPPANSKEASCCY